MPTLADYDDLPYLRAFVEELHRFRPLVPAGVPHVATEDASFKGYIIPKGSMIFQNTWGIFRDPALYDDPDVFRPERFLESQYGTKMGADVTDLRDNLAFGAGRRICPGAEVARRSIAINTMSLLWAFQLSSEEKMSLELNNYIVPGLELAPKPFTCKATIRDRDRERMVRDSYMVSRKD